jgi:hypothetical protein
MTVSAESEEERAANEARLAAWRQFVERRIRELKAIQEKKQRTRSPEVTRDPSGEGGPSQEPGAPGPFTSQGRT